MTSGSNMKLERCESATISHRYKSNLNNKDKSINRYRLTPSIDEKLLDRVSASNFNNDKNILTSEDAATPQFSPFDNNGVTDDNKSRSNSTGRCGKSTK
jgi:hypothetical protein